MHPCQHAKTHPDKAAYIMGNSGETVTFKQLDDRSNQIAHAFRGLGLNIGDTIAIFAENSARYFEICWAAQRSGLYFVCISSRLTTPEVQYIIEDSGAELLIASAGLKDIAQKVKAVTKCKAYWSIDGDIDGYEPLETVRASLPATPIADERAGTDMLYSSGTTGRPKGIRPPLPEDPAIDAANALIANPTAARSLIRDELWQWLSHSGHKQWESENKAASSEATGHVDAITRMLAMFDSVGALYNPRRLEQAVTNGLKSLPPAEDQNSP